LTLLSDAIEACTPGTEHYDIAAASALDNYSMINALSTGWNGLDTLFNTPGTILQIPAALGINADATHVTREGSASIDDYLTAQAIQVHESYADGVYYARTETLTAANVFKRAKQEIAHYNGTASGVGSFSHVGSLGTGTGNYTKDNNYCAVQLEVLVMSGIGSNDLQLKLYGTQQGPAHSFINVTIPAGSPVGTIVDIGTSTDKFVDTPVAYCQAAGGDNGDGIIIQSKLLREISLG
jgi:hypothetical protein